MPQSKIENRKFRDLVGTRLGRSRDGVGTFLGRGWDVLGTGLGRGFYNSKIPLTIGHRSSWVIFRPRKLFFHRTWDGVFTIHLMLTLYELYT